MICGICMDVTIRAGPAIAQPSYRDVAVMKQGWSDDNSFCRCVRMEGRRRSDGHRHRRHGLQWGAVIDANESAVENCNKKTTGCGNLCLNSRQELHRDSVQNLCKITPQRPEPAAAGAWEAAGGKKERPHTNKQAKGAMPGMAVLYRQLLLAPHY
jgi:hypothetical protein